MYFFYLAVQALMVIPNIVIDRVDLRMVVTTVMDLGVETITKMMDRMEKGVMNRKMMSMTNRVKTVEQVMDRREKNCDGQNAESYDALEASKNDAQNGKPSDILEEPVNGIITEDPENDAQKESKAIKGKNVKQKRGHEPVVLKKLKPKTASLRHSARVQKNKDFH